MSEFKDFDDYYRSLSDRQIIEILQDNADRYQPAALEAARKILEQRGLDENSIERVKEELVREQKPSTSIFNIRIQSSTKLEEPEENSPDILPLNVHVKKSQIERILFALNGFWTFYALYALYIFFRRGIANIVDNSVYHPLDSLIIIVPTIVMVLAVIRFIQRKTSGWMLLLFYCILIIPNYVLTFQSYFQWFLETNEESTFPLWFYYEVVLICFCILLIIFTIYNLLRTDCMKIFKITVRQKQITISIAIFFAILISAYLLRVY